MHLFVSVVESDPALWPCLKHFKSFLSSVLGSQVTEIGEFLYSAVPDPFRSDVGLSKKGIIHCKIILKTWC